MTTLFRFALGFTLATCAVAGPFAPAAGQPGSDAIAVADPRFTTWATSVSSIRGPVDIAYPEDEVYVNFGVEANATGPADATAAAPYPVISLGDGGSADLKFAVPFGDIPGPDFAVFENGFVSFNTTFLELAHVEVSSDGIHFYRFPSTSLTPLSTTPGEGTNVNATNVRNLAGKYVAGFGTPFDLAELRALYPALDTQRIIQVRVIDVIGTNDPTLASRDATGNIIADPYPTAYPTGGFDLDATGAFQPTTTTYSAWAASQGLTNTAATADPDHNGVPNLIEYLTTNGAVELTGNTLHFSRLSYRTGGNLKLQASTDLLQWTTLAESANGAAMQSADGNAATVSESGGFRKDVSVQLLTGATRRYFRLAASPVP
ncbi:MAG: hypothetical protein ABIS50_24955 [Luteolibacter sp.]|uniref:hypothetical protein n=1 Tax=Luteolibacter sp. TaxID=1962973 RepID=UPI003264DFD6